MKVGNVIVSSEEVVTGKDWVSSLISQWLHLDNDELQTCVMVAIENSLVATSNDWVSSTISHGCMRPKMCCRYVW